jgi:hypothetical protein
MGLDMYLNAKRYISQHFDKSDGDRAGAIQKLFPELAGRQGRWGDASPVKEVSIEAGYWRKANAVHDWFVKNCQGGVDECQYTYVNRESLKELREACETVLADRAQAPNILPTASGFFFGNTDYDEYYFQDLESTIRIIDECLALPDSWEFEYHSSW